MSRLRIAGSLAIVLALVGSGVARPAAAAHHEAVIQVVSVHVKPGKLEKYSQEVAKLNGVMKRLGSSGTLRMWNTTAGGPDTGTVLVGIEYPNSAAWAADSPKVGADPEWRKIVAGLDDLRTLDSNSIWRDISPTAAAAGDSGSGSVLAITGVQVNPGKLGAYLERLKGARAITERLGMSGNIRVWHAELAGPNTGAVAVGVEYADLASYAADQGKLATDAEWKKLLADLDGLRTVTGRWLYQEITP